MDADADGTFPANQSARYGPLVREHGQLRGIRAYGLQPRVGSWRASYQ